MTDYTWMCRICLQNGATVSIFKDTEEGSIHSKMSFCMNQNITDIPGYPRNICCGCDRMLDIVYILLTKYKKTCSILEKKAKLIKPVIKAEPLSYFINNNDTNDFSEVVEGFIDMKYEPDIDTDEICLEDKANPLPAEEIKPLPAEKIKPLPAEKIKPLLPKIKKKKQIIKTKTELRPRNKKIAASMLEGEFSWTGAKWCLEIGQTVIKAIKKKEATPKTIKVEKPKENKIFQEQKLCDLCGEVFKNSEKLSLHKKNTHFKNPVQCPICPRVLVSEYYLNRHIIRKHENKKDFICAICGKGFAFKAELSSHCRSVHNKEKKAPRFYSCKICDKKYKCAKSVIIHERSVHTGQRPAECSICGSCFYHEDYLKEHMRLHTGETPYKCPICGRGYAQLCNMKSHIRIHRVSELDSVTLSKLKPSLLKRLKM